MKTLSLKLDDNFFDEAEEITSKCCILLEIVT